MKKVISILILGVLIISGLGAVATPIEEDNHQTTTLSFSQPILREKDNTMTVELTGTNSVLLRKNHYMVPTLVETFTFPFGTEIKSVQCIPKNIHNQQISKELMVAPEPVRYNQITQDIQTKSISTTPKSIQTWFDYDIGTGMINRNERGVIVKVEVFPVQYDQSNNMIEYAEEVQIDIEYNEPENPLTFEDEYIFVVLTADTYSDELEDLIQHKNDRGISTILVTLDDVYSGVHFPAEGRDNQEKIKYFIKSAIETWGTSNVLIVGGNMQFPARLTHIHVDSNPPDNELFLSDLYYADIYNGTGYFSSWDTNENDVFGEYDWGTGHLYDEVDLYPDVFLGRLPCINAGQVTTVVDKIITYETNEAYTQEWFGDLIVFGGDSFPEDGNEIDEGELVNEEVIDVMDGFVPNRMWASEGDLSGIVPSGVTKMTNALNEGAGFIDFSGHGNPSVWATHPHEDHTTWLPTPTGSYYNSHVADLTNGDELPIVIIGACSVSKYNDNNNCFSWAFVSNPDGGAIATLGATGLGWAYTGTGVIQGLIEGMAINTFEAYRDEGALTFGEMWSKAIYTYIHTGMEAVDYKTIEEWQPFGDPTLALGEESQAPVTPEDLDGPTTGQINEEHTYTASATDPDGDQIFYLFDWGDGEFSGWVGPYDSGDTGDASHTWTEQGDFEIRVKAKDDHGIQSEWSDPLPITMPKSNAVIDPILLQILERLFERFPLLEQFLQSLPLVSSLLGI